MPSRKDGPQNIWDTHGRSGNVFANRMACFSVPYQSQIHGSLMYQNTRHLMWRMKAKHQLKIREASQDSQPEIQSSLGRISKNHWADQQRLQILDPHFDKFTTSTTFACWKVRFKTEVCTCSQFLTEAMLWIKEVEMVDSVDEFKSLYSVRRIQMPKFEVFDAKIASALNRIIHNTRFKRKVNLEEMKAHKEDRFLRGRRIA